jgi:hypothetical protein
MKNQIIDWPKMRDILRIKKRLGENINELPEEGFMDKPLINRVIDHLKFLGYEVEIKQGRGICHHKMKYPFILTGYFGGIFLKTLYFSNDYAKMHKEDFLSFVN